MKLLGKLFLALIVVVVVAGVYFYLSFKTSTPRDLGVTYSETDRAAGREKSQIVYEELPQGNTVTWQTSGKRDVDVVFTSKEITAIMNNKPGIYYPYKNVQVKFNSDGTGEISGSLVKSRIPIYAATFNAPKVAVDLAMKFLPDDPVFYLKGRASLLNNKVDMFEPIRFEIGRVPMPLNQILASHKLVKTSHAMDINGLMSEISGVSNKKQLIIEFINQKLSEIEGFYATDAHFEDNKLIYKGTLPETEATVR